MSVNKGILVGVLILISLTGCQYKNTEQTNRQLEETTVTNEVMEENKDKLSDEAETYPYNPNHYYNVSAKYNEEYTYVVFPEGLGRIKDGEEKWELLYQGNLMLGGIADGYLFFYSYPGNIDEAAIMALNLSDLSVIESYSLGEEIYNYHEMYFENGKIWIQGSEEIYSFEIENDGKLILCDTEIIDNQLPDSGQNSVDTVLMSKMITKEAGIPYSIYAGYEEKGEVSNILYLYKNGKLENTIKDITDVLITPRGFIGRDAQNRKDIYLWNLDGKKSCALYMATDNHDEYVGYNTYDEKGIYGIQQKDESTYDVVCISWEGEQHTLFSIQTDSKLVGVQLKMSVIQDWIYYINPSTGNMQRRNLHSIDKVEPVTIG